ncbi:uncharacterized protein FIBRA_09553 [Fibroporia radiculosa]|uniref:Uncharacterized protein n=1 Tax=Fibroporia radiculosa TaxID=599839 RepID=J7S6M9_9APHY|nr:uncharacterized protein FIBRA_09553 [Fibroporia radiculosa]CCM07209.1 predicted protein [Fibroporia radiculosa]
MLILDSSCPHFIEPLADHPLVLVSTIKFSRFYTKPKAIDFGMEAHRIWLDPKERHDIGQGSSNDDSDNQGSNHACFQNLDAQLTLIWNQMSNDILKVSSNFKASSDPPYYMLTEAECCMVTEELFKSFELPF